VLSLALVYLALAIISFFGTRYAFKAKSKIEPYESLPDSFWAWTSQTTIRNLHWSRFIFVVLTCISAIGAIVNFVQWLLQITVR
jgi:hypothetical protein